MIVLFLIIAFIVFLGYAMVTQYRATSPDQTIPKRVLAAMVAAVGALAAAIASWAQGWGG